MRIRTKTADRQTARGFTIIEILVVIALMAATAVMSMPLLSNSLSKNELDAAAESAADALNEARSSAFSGKGGGKFGVHFEAGKFAFFAGDTYEAGNQDNSEYLLPGFVTITGINLSDSGADIVFADVSGSPAQFGEIVFTDSAEATRTVSVNAAGTVESR